MSARSSSFSFALLLLMAVLVPFVAGCGDGKFPVRAARGKVVSNGQPVSVGTVTFTPMGEEGALEAGKPATGAVGPDGTFVLTTHDRFDGAIVGKHRVQYVGAEDEEGEGAAEEDEGSTAAEGSAEERAQNAKRAAAQKSRQRFMQNGEIVVEVKADGDNDFTIELVPAPKGTSSE